MQCASLTIFIVFLTFCFLLTFSEWGIVHMWWAIPTIFPAEHPTQSHRCDSVCLRPHINYEWQENLFSDYSMSKGRLRKEKREIDSEVQWESERRPGVALSWNWLRTKLTMATWAAVPWQDNARSTACMCRFDVAQKIVLAVVQMIFIAYTFFVFLATHEVLFLVV